MSDDIEIDDGGYAFPSNGYEDNGMSLRDWFAGQALSHIANPGLKSGEADAVARYAYAIADEMLKARAS